MIEDPCNGEKIFEAWLKEVKTRHDHQSNHIKVCLNIENFTFIKKFFIFICLA